jgi:hypothetical protein
MKQVIVLIALIFAAAFSSNIYAQQTTPPGAGDKDLRDTDVKRRSMELERIERNAKKRDKGGSVNKTEDKSATKFDEIKADYEQIQLSQDEVVKTYKNGEKIDYAQIAKSASEVNKSAKRLDSNLFSSLEVKNTSAKKEEKRRDKTETESKKSIQELIVELDNTIGSFVTSPMFQNLQVVDVEATKKAKLELEKIIELSALLSVEAQKMAAADK